MKISSRGRYKDSWLGNFKSLIIYTVSIYHKHKQCGPTTTLEYIERGSKHRVNTSQLSSYLVRLRRPSFEDKYGAGNLLQILTQSTI
ncbi:hypothetical protein ABKN59_008438 [Abortiporus biennis]